jgi:hypothetical protein
MRWFRSNRSLGGCLALFALGFQLVASFAHIHLQDLGRSIDIGRDDQAAIVQASTPANGSVTIPSGHHGNGLPDDACPICASLQLVATALISLPPIISEPTAFRFILLEPAIDEFLIDLNRYFSYQTRAPPAI